MRNVRRFRLLTLGLVVLVGLASCAHMGGGGKRTAGGVKVKHVDIGSAADSVNAKITNVSHTFKTTDTVYLVVTYDNSGTDNATLETRWYNGTNQVGSQSATAMPGEHSAFFSLHPEAGLVAGDYHVEVWVNGRRVENKDFDVKAS
jgi:hypothetical protein